MGVVFIQQNIDMKKFLWVIGGVLMLWGIPLSGQQSVAPEIPESAVRMTKVSGQVVDENTGDGIPLATISVTGLGWGTVCDMKGYFKVEVPVNQPAELTVRSVGYETKTLVLESDVTGNLVVRLKKSLLNLDEVTVTGTRTEKTVAETPVMTRIVPSEVLQRNDFESMIDVLEYNIPGLRFNTDPRGNNIQVQGLENSYILILVDGERLSTTPGGPIDFDRLTTANIKKIEVLKGAASALYGSSAMGMVINIITDIPKRPLEGWAKVRYGKWIRKYKYDTKALVRYIENSRCDVVHIHGFMSPGAVQAINAAYGLNKKIVYSPHFHPFRYLRHPMKGKLWFHLFLKPVLFKVDTIVTINNEDTRFFGKYHPNVKKIPHWSTTDTNVLDEVEKQDNMVLFIGRNDTNKGIEHLYTLSDNCQVHCVCKGTVKRDDFILHQNLGDAELACLYRQASVVVVPSRYEAFSLVALEALQHHTPVVISERVRIGDYLKGDKGYRVFNYHDYEGFKDAVSELMMSKDTVNYNQLLAPFDKEKIREEYCRIYNC